MLYYVCYFVSMFVSEALFACFKANLLAFFLATLCLFIGGINGKYYESTRFKQITLLFWPAFWVTIVAFFPNHGFSTFAWFASIIAMPLMYGLALNIRNTGVSLTNDEIETPVTINNSHYMLVAAFFGLTDAELDRLIEETERQKLRSPDEFIAKLISRAKGKIVSANLVPDDPNKRFEVIMIEVSSP